jgi:AcrR family transcriptional regulator
VPSLDAEKLAVTPHGLRTRAALLDAGRELAADGGLAGLSVSGVARRAGVAKGTFYVHFADRDAFVRALRDDFNERIGERVAAAVADIEPGARRLLVGLTAYLDACLDDRALKALVREARDDVEPRDRLVTLVAANLRGMGVRDAASAARLVVAMAAEVALAENEAGKKEPGARRALRRFVAGAAGPTR